MKKWLVILPIIIAVGTAGFFALPKIIDKVMQGGGERCVVASGDWEPQRGECPGETVEMRGKCNTFCEKYPTCCGERNENAGGAFGGKGAALALPSKSAISKLKRSYPMTIKALNEGPNIYTREGKPEVLSDETLQKVKAIGFNTIQVLLIGEKENGKIVFHDVNNSVLLNDIVAMKKNGLAVWVALDMAGGPADSRADLGNYSDFKASFLDFAKKSAELLEKYKVEYLTASNEPDKPFKEQKSWSRAEINDNLVDFMPDVNAVARKEFKGKLINKITKTQNHTQKVIDASFENIDIAGVDVGPPMDSHTSLSVYKKDFAEYQYFATLAEKVGVPWMNAEYWQGDFDYEYNSFVKNNELEFAKVSFDAYLKTTPKGVGYVWNDIRTLSLPQGEKTAEALKAFFEKI